MEDRQPVEQGRGHPPAGADPGADDLAAFVARLPELPTAAIKDRVVQTVRGKISKSIEEVYLGRMLAEVKSRHARDPKTFYAWVSARLGWKRGWADSRTQIARLPDHLVRDKIVTLEVMCAAARLATVRLQEAAIELGLRDDLPVDRLEAAAQAAAKWHAQWGREEEALKRLRDMALGKLVLPGRQGSARKKKTPDEKVALAQERLASVASMLAGIDPDTKLEQEHVERARETALKVCDQLNRLCRRRVPRDELPAEEEGRFGATKTDTKPNENKDLNDRPKPTSGIPGSPAENTGDQAGDDPDWYLPFMAGVMAGLSKEEQAEFCILMSGVIRGIAVGAYEYLLRGLWERCGLADRGVDRADFDDYVELLCSPDLATRALAALEFMVVARPPDWAWHVHLLKVAEGVPAEVAAEVEQWCEQVPPLEVPLEGEGPEAEDEQFYEMVCQMAERVLPEAQYASYEDQRRLHDAAAQLWETLTDLLGENEPVTPVVPPGMPIIIM